MSREGTPSISISTTPTGGVRHLTGNSFPPSYRPSSTFRWNVTRGVLIGASANLVGETLHNFYVNWKLLAREYVSPASAKEFYKFTQATLSLDNFRRSMRTRAQYAVTIGAIDWGSRIAAYRYFNNGWQSNLSLFSIL